MVLIKAGKSGGWSGRPGTKYLPKWRLRVEFHSLDHSDRICKGFHLDFVDFVYFKPEYFSIKLLLSVNLQPVWLLCASLSLCIFYTENWSDLWLKLPLFANKWKVCIGTGIILQLFIHNVEARLVMNRVKRRVQCLPSEIFGRVQIWIAYTHIKRNQSA